MSKRFTTFFVAFLLLIGLVSHCVWAINTHDDGYTYVIDEANLLNAYEKSNLEERLQKISNQYNLDVVAATVKTTNGQSIGSYTDSYFTSENIGRNESEDGILLLIASDDRQFYVLTNGYATTYLSSYTRTIVQDIRDYLTNGEYYNAINTYASRVNHYLTYGTGGRTSRGFLDKLVYLPMALMIGCVFAFAIVSSYKSQLKTVVGASGASNYATTQRLNLTLNNDQLIDRHVRRTPIPRQTTVRPGGPGHMGGGHGGFGGPGGRDGAGSGF